MDFTGIHRWMNKMNQILEFYADETSFTQAEKNLLLDYNNRIKNAISELKVDLPKLEEPDQESEPNSDQIEAESKPTETKSNKASSKKSNLTAYSELFDIKQADDLSEKLKSTTIQDIGSAMGLNERVLFQNILFNGEKQGFEQAIQKLNAFADFSQAQNYLCDELVGHYNWMDETKLKNAQLFIKLIKRKYA